MPQKVQVLKRIFSEDIEQYAKFFFPSHLKLETPDFHREIISLYQSAAPRIAIGAPRGHAKSTITDLVFLSWLIVHKKVRFVLLISDTYSQAVLFLDGLKAELEANERLRAFYGDLTSPNWSEGEIVTNDIMVKAIGAGMKVRGLKYRDSRPDLILVDDLENDEAVQSMERREKLERWFNAAVIPSMTANGRVIVIGTILHYDSLLAKMLSDTQYTEYVKRTYKAVTDGKALWPEHLSLEKLELIKKSFVEKGLGFQFYQEYMNDPISDENRKFKIEKMKYYEEADLEGKAVSIFITIDRAYSTSKTADSTGIVVNAVTADNIWYVRQAERFKGNEGELIRKIFDLKNHWNPVRIGIEQKAYEDTIRVSLTDEMKKRNDFFMVEELKDQRESKTRRIEGLVPRFEAGTIYIKRTFVDLIDELIQFPRAVHDDVSDALAYQLNIASPDYRNQVIRKKPYRPMTKYGG